MSLECSSNILHLRTCVDSCIALRDLLVYLATNGDLRPHSQETVQLRDYSSLVSDVSPPSSLVGRIVVLYLNPTGVHSEIPLSWTHRTKCLSTIAMCPYLSYALKLNLVYSLPI